jgi:hypothetical protein
MARYANSRPRLALMVVLIGAALFIMTGTGLAQTDAARTSEVSQSTSVFSLIMANRDPVFFTIIGLSIWGLTLIIQGFLVNRPSVIMPPRTIETIRDMIAQRRFKELIDFTETDPSFVSRALNPALKRAPSFNSMKEAMETAVGEQTADQFRKIEYLNIIGNLGPAGNGDRYDRGVFGAERFGGQRVAGDAGVWDFQGAGAHDAGAAAGGPMPGGVRDFADAGG